MRRYPILSLPWREVSSYENETLSKTGLAGDQEERKDLFPLSGGLYFCSHGLLPYRLSFQRSGNPGNGGRRADAACSVSGDSSHGSFFCDLSFLYQFFSHEEKEEGTGALSCPWHGPEKYCFCTDLGKPYDCRDFSGSRNSGRHPLFQAGTAGHDLSAGWESRFFFFYKFSCFNHYP